MTIDYKAGKAIGDNCEVKFLDKQPVGGLVFERKDFALPYFPMEAKSILEWTPLLTDMNRYELKVTGLPAGKYSVRLGGKAVAEYTAKDLEEGVNLARPALTTGPVADQVQKVWTAVKTKNQYFHDQIFRGVLLAGNKSPIFKGVEPAGFEAARKTAYDDRMKKMPELDAAVRAALAITPHQVELVAVEK